MFFSYALPGNANIPKELHYTPEMRIYTFTTFLFVITVVAAFGE